ncbi:MAG: hypothetical protein ACO3DD_00075 [Burkholderiaceae bacterium]
MNLTSLLEPQLRAMGRRLREQRLAQDINPRALETDLRTTHRHLLAIEEGQTRLFYSDSFFCDLFTRYALALGFSAQEAQDMVATLRTPVAPIEPTPPELASGETPDATPEATSDATLGSLPQSAPEEGATAASEASPEPGLGAQTAGGQEQLALGDTFMPPEPAAETAAVAALQTGSAGQESTAPVSAQPSEVSPKDPVQGTPQKSSFPTLLFVFLVALVLVFWLVSQQEEEPKAIPSVSVAPERFEKSEATEKPAASPTSSAASGGSGTSSQIASSPVGPGSAPANAPAPVVLAGPTGQTQDASLKAAAVPSVEPPSVATPVANEPEGSPELELVFRTRGWVWVREANDSVREFVVSEGGVVRFQEMPIFIVLPAPDQIDAKVFGRSVSLKRTEEEKNHGRYTRTMLRQAANLGRLPTPPAN